MRVMEIGLIERERAAKMPIGLYVLASEETAVTSSTVRLQQQRRIHLLAGNAQHFSAEIAGSMQFPTDEIEPV